MNVTLAQMTVSLTPSPAQAMPDARIDAETTQLAAKAQDGDADAFCALIDLHERAARRVAATALGNTAEADEAVQEACITAWRRIGRLEDPAAFRAWLLRITWRKALDRRRSLRAWLKRLAGGPATGNPQSRGFTAVEVDVARLADRRIAPDTEMLNAERDRVVQQMIQSLPARLRDPFLLAASGEHRYDDIASMLGVPAGTVKWRVSEARRVLRDKLTRLGFQS